MKTIVINELKKQILEKQNVKYVYSMAEGLIFNQLVNLKQITFEVTDACNLKCLYCAYGEYYNFYKERKNSFMPFEYAKNIIDYLVNIWNENTSVSNFREVTISFYGGEPLLNISFIKKVVEYVEKLHVCNVKFKFSMTTNSILLDKYMAYLVDKRFKILISLDGDKVSHSYRVDHKGNNSFQKVVNNVFKLMKEYPEYYLKHVEFNSVLTNRSNVEGIRAYIYDKFKKKTNISELSLSGVDPDKEKNFKVLMNSYSESIDTSTNPDLLNDELFDKSPYVMGVFNFMRAFSGNYFENYHSLITNDNNKKYYPTGTCIPFEKKIFITVYGLILPCERIAHKYSLGCVSEKIVEIDCRKIAKRYTSYYRSMKKQCSFCYRKPICFQCMFHISGLMEKNVQCHGFADKELFEQDIQQAFSYLSNHPSIYERLSKELLFSK